MTAGYKVAGVDLDSILAPWHTGWPQASLTKYQVNGADFNGRYATLAAGSAPSATGIKVGGTDLSAIFAALGTTNVQVGTQPSAVSGSAAAGIPSGTVTSNTTTVAGSKGGGTYSYICVVVITVGSGVTATAPSSATSGVTGNIPQGTTYSGTMHWNISDGVTSINTNSVAWSLTNTSTFTPSTVTHTTAGSGTETVPAGATNVVIEVKGGGAGSSATGFTQAYACGGGGAGYCRSSYACSGGQTIAYTVGQAGSTNLNQNGIQGGDSTASSGTLTITTMTGQGGNGATNNGTGGTGSGGNQANATGANGVDGGAGGASGAAGVNFDTGNAFGHGGTFNGTNVTGGFVCFRYT